MAKTLLEIENLTTEFSSRSGKAVAVDRVSFSVSHGSTVGVVGESGSGKSVTALSVMRLVPRPSGRIVGGRVLLNAEDLLRVPETRMREIRGNRISMIFQEPMSSLNPVFTAGRQISEVLQLHQGLTRSQARARAVELLHQVGISSPEQRSDAYPHQLSGGMRQRVLVAMALACGPELLIADEPTSALDVTIQAQVLELIRGLQRERRMSMVLITHDLGVVAQTCDQVVVMYAGAVVERAPVRPLFRAPAHPYTAGLLRSIPRISAGPGTRPGRLAAIPGMVPALGRAPSGCRFRDRCEHASDECRAVDPPLQMIGDARWVACHHPLSGRGVE